jgi:hypothetical protein
MSKNRDDTVQTPRFEQSRKAGDLEHFPGGKITYLAPLPLPTPMPPHGPHIGELNEVCMDFGLGWTCPYQTGHQLPVKLMLLPSA